MRDKTEKKVKIRQVVTVISILAFFAALFTGCGARKEQIIEKEVIAVPMPENTSLTGLFLHHTGMAMEPYYLYQVTEDAAYMKITDTYPENGYLTDADTVKDEEYASLVRTEDAQITKKLEEAIVAAGALGWDGYNKKASGTKAADNGDCYLLYLELSDGTCVTMNGYNICPAGFDMLLGSVSELFWEYSDYSRYGERSSETGDVIEEAMQDESGSPEESAEAQGQAEEKENVKTAQNTVVANLYITDETGQLKSAELEKIASENFHRIIDTYGIDMRIDVITDLGSALDIREAAESLYEEKGYGCTEGRHGVSLTILVHEDENGFMLDDFYPYAGGDSWELTQNGSWNICRDSGTWLTQEVWGQSLEEDRKMLAGAALDMAQGLEEFVMAGGVVSTIWNPVIQGKPLMIEEREDGILVTFYELPKDAQQMQSLTDFYGMEDARLVCALFHAALVRYPESAQDCYDMIDVLRGPQPMSDTEKAFMEERFSDKLYLPRAYFEGAEPENEYEPDMPWTIVIYDDPAAPPDGYAYVSVRTKGADNPRRIVMRKKGDNCYLWEYNGALLGIRLPASEDPWL